MNPSESPAVVRVGVSLVLLTLACLMPNGGAQAKTMNEQKDAQIGDRSALLGDWIHSSEEQKAGENVQVYRPASSMKFPPSRFRMEYIFSSNGRCEFFFLSPDDNHRFKPCRWKTDAVDRSILELTTSSGTALYRIIELSKDVLRLTPLTVEESN